MIFFFSGSQSYSFAAKNTNGAASIVAEPQYVKKICRNFFIKNPVKNLYDKYNTYIFAMVSIMKRQECNNNE